MHYSGVYGCQEPNVLIFLAIFIIEPVIVYTIEVIFCFFGTLVIVTLITYLAALVFIFDANLSVISSLTTDALSICCNVTVSKSHLH